MSVRHASAQWKGDLKSGNGHLRLGSGLFDTDYGFATRFGEEPGTNPEELIGAALAACYSMALSAELGKAGKTADSIQTDAGVKIEQQAGGFSITSIALNVKASVPELDDKDFQKIAETVKQNCPVSKALAGTKIELTASLI